PATGCEGIGCERAELLRRPGGPVRLPMEGIELHVREVHYLCEHLGKRGLANATGANHDHTRHLGFHTILRRNQFLRVDHSDRSAWSVTGELAGRYSMRPIDKLPLIAAGSLTNALIFSSSMLATLQKFPPESKVLY